MLALCTTETTAVSACPAAILAQAAVARTVFASLSLQCALCESETTSAAAVRSEWATPMKTQLLCGGRLPNGGIIAAVLVIVVGAAIR